jgi:hypothetical protein
MHANCSAEVLNRRSHFFSHPNSALRNPPATQFLAFRRPFLIDTFAIRNRRKPLKTLGRDQV